MSLEVPRMEGRNRQTQIFQSVLGINFKSDIITWWAKQASGAGTHARAGN